MDSFDVEKELLTVIYTTKKQIEKGLDKAALLLINRLEEASENNPKTHTNKYKKSWKVNKKYKTMRIMHNKKQVEGAKGFIPLSNILNEEGTDERANKVFDELAEQLGEIILNEIEL